MAITTKRGDYGETDLMFGRRVPKDHPRVVAVLDLTAGAYHIVDRALADPGRVE